MKRTEVQFMADIFEEIISIENTIKDIDYEAFVSNEIKLRAVKYSLIIIGEAANKLSSETQTKYNAVSWKDIISLRNRIVHAYFGLKVRLLWDIITNELENLKQTIKLMISNEYPEEAVEVFKYYDTK
ncbi:MAG: DUF86 domain-containing protein [Bacteroidetes bacterium]|nr:MAG: DUF86 domain-containing protein [Bacteroidota bacterium]